MAYEKQTWQTGDVVTAEKLNHMENGIANVLFVTSEIRDGNTGTIQNTWQELYNAMLAGKLIYFISKTEGIGSETITLHIARRVSMNPGGYEVIFSDLTGSSQTYNTSSPDGNPAETIG